MKEKMLNRFVAIIILFTIISCDSRDKYETTERSFEYKEQHWNRYSVSRTLNGITYKATEVPLVYYLLKNAKESEIDSLLQVNKRERILEIEFSQIEEKDLLEEQFTHRDYKKSVSYMAFDIKKDFRIITDNHDTIKCSGVLFERNYKVAPFKRLLLYFDGVPPDSGIRLLYDDQLFGQGFMKFNLATRPIQT